ncbi:membrane protein insertase YidC [Schaalia sp. ZJ1691]|uniref:membrane protein insertase YidC n=1 Tax=Schaalia sp. ZJ1691 TaxID=2709404 RepID=UPI001F14D68B|nr:membrane protein insertase YidC [Schaalia sp. ZJ1691]
MLGLMEKIIHPFAVAIAWVWMKIHDFLTLIGLSEGPGAAWVVSIVLLTIIVRVLILPLFLRQIRSSRSMQAVQPEMQRIQAKYKGKKDPASRQKMAEETQALYKKHKVSPFASCLPLLVQMPVLFGMYRAIYAVKDLSTGTYQFAGQKADSLGPINKSVAGEIDESTVFGVRLSHTITSGDGPVAVVIFVVFIIFMVVMQFLSMRMTMTRNMPTSTAENNPMMQSQKSMLYVMPLMYIFSGGFFQMGVLVYMATASLWAFGQSLWTIKVMPTPGSPAYAELVERRQRAYQEWAKPFFAEYDELRSALPNNTTDERVIALNEKTLQEVQAKAKGQKIASDFPETMSAGDKVSVYRNLSSQTWTTLPDEMWMRGVREATTKSAEKRAQQARREQSRKLSREERLRQSERQREADKRENERQARARQSGVHNGLTPEEIEQRRQERRRARRQKNKGH